jgi:peptide/nickel transport system substrate-binding protein
MNRPWPQRIPTHRFPGRRTLMRAAAALALAVGAVATPAVVGVAPAHAATPSGGTATFAESPGAPPNYIFPMDALQYFNTSNIYQFQDLMWRPLYWFGHGSQVVLNKSLSLAQPPVYSAGDTKVTIHLKSFKWSDGTPVTSRDVTFWMNLLEANKENWGEYAPGYFPDDVTSVSAPNVSTVVFKLNGAVNPTWFTLNELSQITPIPQHVWDRTSAAGTVGDNDTTTAGARAVYTYLDHQSKDLNTYATNPLWHVVDGPWKLSAFSSDGQATFVPNRVYSGTQAQLAKFVEEPFTSDASEYNELRAGDLTYGYVPVGDIAQKSLLTSQGYSVQPWYLWSMNIIPMNFNNPTEGKLFSQVYVRQAMQHLIDETKLESAILSGYGITDNGPIPNGPTAQFVDQTVKTGPLGYSVSEAVHLITGHGWKISSGVASCVRPGTGTTECGAGITAGEPLKLDLVYAAGLASVGQEMQALKSSFSAAGIDLQLATAPASEVYSDAVPCTTTQAACKWGMAFWGNGWQFAPDNYPTGEVAFSSGAVGNFGSYSNTEMDRLIKGTTTEAGAGPLDAWQNYTAQQVPMLFMPVAPYQVSAISTKLSGATPQPTDGLALTPELWSLAK